jgi:hypothetical protein
MPTLTSLRELCADKDCGQAQAAAPIPPSILSIARLFIEVS